MIALVLLVILFFASFKLIVKESKFISQAFGLAPQEDIAWNEATYVIDWTKTSSPFPIFLEAKAILKAAVPEVTARAKLPLNFFLNLLSNDLTL